MPKSRYIVRNSANRAVRSVQFLDADEYREVSQEAKTVEIHLTSALFPKGKITTPRLKEILDRRVPTSGNYNAVFHFGTKRKFELRGKLNKALKAMPSTQGKWFFVVRNKDKAAIIDRVVSVAPIGAVKNSDIDLALAGLSKNPS